MYILPGLRVGDGVKLGVDGNEDYAAQECQYADTHSIMTGSTDSIKQTLPTNTITASWYAAKHHNWE